jgi:hypothetical protein
MPKLSADELAKKFTASIARIGAYNEMGKGDSMQAQRAQGDYLAMVCDADNRDTIAAALRHYAEKPAHDRAMRIARVVDDENSNIGNAIVEEQRRMSRAGGWDEHDLANAACAAIIALAEKGETK